MKRALSPPRSGDSQKGENRERYLGVKIPPSMLKPNFGEPARKPRNECSARRRRASLEDRSVPFRRRGDVGGAAEAEVAR